MFATKHATYTYCVYVVELYQSDKYFFLYFTLFYFSQFTSCILRVIGRSAKRVLAMVEAFVCPSVRLSVCSSQSCNSIKTVQARKSQNFHCGCHKVFCDKISCYWLSTLPSVTTMADIGSNLPFIFLLRIKLSPV